VFAKTYDKQHVKLPSRLIHCTTSDLSDHCVESKRGHGSNGHTLGASLGVEDLSRNDPRQRSASRTETEVVHPGNNDKAPSGSLVVAGARRENSQQDGRDDECHHVSEIAENERPATSKVIDEEDTEELRNEGDNGRYCLVLQCLIASNTHLTVDGDGVVLDGRDTCHLHRGLQSTREKETAEAGLVLEKLHVSLRFVFVLESKLVLNLLKLGLNPWVGLVAMGVQLGKVAETLFHTALIYEPSWTLGEEENECGEKDGRNNLDTKTGAPLTAVGWVKSDIGA
jgi:hypothetical protein